ncbi:hypothetical protein BJ742DRAFT_783523 [Cladochytrium replicatum]|nr:hypothetical protein BJ742DRAFT_783523 [Cladochytrium replicatum]
MISLKAIPTFFDISILELLAAVFWSFITLSTYYSPAVIGNVWMKAIGPLKHGLPKPAEAATAHLPIILFESIVAKWFLQVFEVSSALEGGCVAVLLYLFLGLPSLAGTAT